MFSIKEKLEKFIKEFEVNRENKNGVNINIKNAARELYFDNDIECGYAIFESEFEDGVIAYIDNDLSTPTYGYMVIARDWIFAYEEGYKFAQANDAFVRNLYS